MERCARCGIEGKNIRLYDAIYDGKMSAICERCSIIENIPIIKKPNAAQLREAEKGEEVYRRMKRLSGLTNEEKKDTFFIEDRLKELDLKPELELPEINKLNLIEHFHWDIMRNRRKKGLTQERLAQALAEPLEFIQMLEKAKLPENAEILIKKIEQFFQINLRKITERDKLMKVKKSPILLNEKGKELQIIPEDIFEEKDKIEDGEIEILEYGTEDIEKLKIEELKSEEDFEKIKGVDFEKGELDITKTNLDNVKISDLRRLHKKKIEATKQEKREEARRIEERKKLIEARKEELRLLKEKESRKLDEFLGGAELLEEEDEHLNL
jgi:ribosome-binding protein aMBF1 (putative translation factor)